MEVFYKKKSAGFELEVLLDSPDFEECVGHCDGPFPLHELRACLPTLGLDVVCFPLGSCHPVDSRRLWLFGRLEHAQKSGWPAGRIAGFPPPPPTMDYDEA